MKKSDIIKLVKETVAERRKRYGQHDYYGNNVGGRNSISGMPGVWEEENLDEEGESWGLEPRQLADSFTFEELEQLYNDNKITKEDLNGAKSYLQAWIDQHPTYLPQRDLNTSKRQAIRSYYLDPDRTTPKGGTQSSQFEDKQNKNKMKKIKEATYAGKTAVDDMTNDPAYNALDGDAKMQLKKDLSQGGTATLEEDDGAHLAGEFDKISRSLKDKGGYIGDERLEDLMKTRGTADVSLWHIAKLEEVGIINDSNKAEALKAVGHQGGNALAEYMKERGDSNLMEHMDRHRKRTRLMEGAVKRLFIDFDQGKTNEEIIQDYATKGIQIPDSWISQMRKEWEGFEKMKLNLDIGEKEFKNAATQIVNNPEGSETGMEPPMESKQLANGLTN